MDSLPSSPYQEEIGAQWGLSLEIKLMTIGISKRKREQILERDGGHCRFCGSDTCLEVHHIISITESRQKGLPKQMANRQENLVTMCRPCHSLTYGNRKCWYWLAPEEANELHSIRVEREQLSKEREELKERYYGMWDTSSYITKKRKIDTKFKKLDQREEEIHSVAKQRLTERKDEIYRALSTDSPL